MPVDWLLRAGVGVCFRVRHAVNSFCRKRRDGGGCFLGMLCGGVRVEIGVNRELGAQIPRPFV